MMWGFGLLVQPGGAQYKGHFREGKRWGEGRRRWPSGAAYDGRWEENKRCGQGCFTHENGNEYAGEWARDEPVRGKFFRNNQPWHGTEEDVRLGL
jgi:hypothetical protein